MFLLVRVIGHCFASGDNRLLAVHVRRFSLDKAIEHRDFRIDETTPSGSEHSSTLISE